jgi:hypothetical protein
MTPAGRPQEHRDARSDGPGADRVRVKVVRGRSIFAQKCPQPVTSGRKRRQFVSPGNRLVRAETVGFRAIRPVRAKMIIQNVRKYVG